MYIMYLMGAAVFESIPSYYPKPVSKEKGKEEKKNKWPVLPLSFNIIYLRIYLIQSHG